MKQYTVAELAKNPRAINLKEINKIINQKNFMGKQDFLSFKSENIEHPLVTAALRLLSSSLIVEDDTIFELLRIMLVKFKKLSGDFGPLIEKFETETKDKQLEDISLDTISVACRLSPLVLAAQTGTLMVDTNLIPDNITSLHIKKMLERIDYLYHNFHYPMSSNSLVTSKYQGISGIMDGISEDCILQINASPMKKISSKNIREFLYFYALIPIERRAKIKQMAVYNPRWDLLSEGEVGNIDQDLLDTVSHKISSWDKLTGMSLMDRLK